MTRAAGCRQGYGSDGRSSGSGEPTTGRYEARLQPTLHKYNSSNHLITTGAHTRAEDSTVDCSHSGTC